MTHYISVVKGKHQDFAWGKGTTVEKAKRYARQSLGYEVSQEKLYKTEDDKAEVIQDGIGWAFKSSSDVISLLA